MSNSIKIGRVRPFKSEQYDWSSTYQYEVLELVRYDTITYLCTKVPPVGTLPTNETYFVRLGSDVSIATDTDTGLRPVVALKSGIKGYYDGSKWVLTGT